MFTNHAVCVMPLCCSVSAHTHLLPRGASTGGSCLGQLCQMMPSHSKAMLQPGEAAGAQGQCLLTEAPAAASAAQLADLGIALAPEPASSSNGCVPAAAP